MITIHDLSAAQFIIGELKRQIARDLVSKQRNIDPDNLKLPQEAKVLLGKMRGDKETVEFLYKELTKGSKLEKIKLHIEEVPVEATCECGFSGKVEMQEHVHFVRCPECGKTCHVEAGDEIQVFVGS